MLRNKLLAVGAVIAGFMLPAQAMAYEAYTEADLNLRVGPAVDYGVIDVIPYGDPVEVLGCLDGIEWCDVEWYGLRGWVAARYLVQPGTSVYLPQVYTSIGLPIISFSFDTYHDRHYRDRPWYKKRHGRWRGRDYREARRPRGDDREERQEEAEQPRQRRDTERPRQLQETERPRQRQETERPRQQRETERPRQRQQAERPRQQREVERPRQKRAEQPRQRQAEPRQGERTQRSRQAERSQGQGRGPSGPPEELELERGQ